MSVFERRESRVQSYARSFPTVFTTADNYVVQIHRPLEDPLRSLVVASAVSVDLALKQDQGSQQHHRNSFHIPHFLRITIIECNTSVYDSAPPHPSAGS